MYFCYFDESGDSGYQNSPSQAFTLGCVLVDDTNWLSTLDQIVQFRRYLKDNFRIPPRMEIKANSLIHGRGPISQLNLSFNARMNAYLAAMRFQRNLSLTRTFAILINKDQVRKQTVDVRQWAWERAIERLERFGTAEGKNLHIIPDEGHGFFIRRLLRKMRRIHTVRGHYGSTLTRRAENIVEDISERDSKESYFVQLADLNAYAAYRVVYPSGTMDRKYWDELGTTRINEVNRLSGGPTGIVIWPK